MPLIGLGGSAGSIEPLQRFFSTVPPNTGMVFVVVLHLSPERESLMPEVLARVTKMQVFAATDGVRMEPNSVYVIPPGRHLTVGDGHLRLTELEPERGTRVAVDLFFRSMADSYGPHATAIILSGADGDGAIGIKRVKERGGLTIAQDPADADHRGMPQTAIATGMVDWVLPVAEMPGRLLAYYASESRLRLPAEDGPQPAQTPRIEGSDNETALREVLALLRARTGRDLSYYKRGTIVRRISRRMQINGTEDVPSYLGFMRTHPGEAGALLQDVLISVTNFFRDREAFAALEQLFPEIFKGKGPGDFVRIWTPACATGEEAYSMAMLALEYAHTLDHPPNIQVFGCDLDDHAIQTARAGQYPSTIAADVSEDRLRRFFIKEGGGYKIRREVRELVLFAAHDLIKDSPFSRMDLISCRNIMIYLTKEAQNRIVDLFHFSLRANGLLFLGLSEAVDESSGLFEVVNKKFRIYRQVPAQRTTLPVPLGESLLARSLKIAEMHVPSEDRVRAAIVTTQWKPHREESLSTASELHLRLIERFAPASLVVDSDYEIVHLSQKASRYLKLAAGAPTANLLRLVHPALEAELRAALFQAKSGAHTQTKHVMVESAGETEAVTIRVAPENSTAPGYWLVTFDAAPATGVQAEPSFLLAETEPVARQLERELEVVKRRLRDTVEQHEANTEELKSGNEELQAMNEELRSASEELETSREELQSINEELSTVNQELKCKLDELSNANSDLHNLMASTAIPTIFLDRDLRITRFTPSAVSLFQLIASDVGRPLSDLRHHLEYPELSQDAQRVLEQLTPVERQIHSTEGGSYLARLLPYRTLDDRIGGLVLAFINVTEIRRVEVSRAYLAAIVESSEDSIIGTNLDGVITSWNRAAERLYGYPAGEAIGKAITMLTLPADFADILDKAQEVKQSLRVATFDGIRIHKDQHEMWLSITLSPIKDDGGKINGISIIARDITARRRAEQAFRETDQRLQLILENAREFAIFSMDTDRRVTTWNSGGERLLGYREKEIIGVAADVIFTQEDRVAAAPEMEQSTALKEGKAVDERWHLRKDGSRFWGSGFLMVMRDKSGAPVGFVKILHDRTAEKETAEQLKLSREELEQAGRTKDYFLAVLSHELRTPLTPVLMAAESLLRRKDLPPRAIEALQMICRNIEVETHLVDDLLDISKISRGALEVRRDPIDLHEAIRAAIAITAVRFEGKQQTLDVSLDAKKHKLQGDSRRLQQVFWNLLINASKFTPEQGAVAIASYNEDKMICVAIKDNGRGIDSSRLDEIFAAFKQGDEEVAREFGGLGLGLAISKATIEELGGVISAASEGPGRGSTFIVKLPLGDSES